MSINLGNVGGEAKAFASTHKRLLVEVGLVLLVALLGFMSGRFTRHPEVKTVTVTQTQVKTEIQYKDRIVTQKVYVQVEKKHEHVEQTTVKRPDGTVETHTTTDDQVDEREQANSTQDAQHQQQTTQTVVQKVTETKTVTLQANWAVFAGAGVSLPYYLGQPELGIPGMRGWVVEAGAGRRLGGPVWLDLKGTTQGTVGLDLRVQW